MCDVLCCCSATQMCRDICVCVRFGSEVEATFSDTREWTRPMGYRLKELHNRSFSSKQSSAETLTTKEKTRIPHHERSSHFRRLPSMYSAVICLTIGRTVLVADGLRYDSVSRLFDWPTARAPFAQRWIDDVAHFNKGPEHASHVGSVESATSSWLSLSTRTFASAMRQEQTHRARLLKFVVGLRKTYRTSIHTYRRAIRM